MRTGMGIWVIWVRLERNLRRKLADFRGFVRICRKPEGLTVACDRRKALRYLSQRYTAYSMLLLCYNIILLLAKLVEQPDRNGFAWFSFERPHGFQKSDGFCDLPQLNPGLFPPCGFTAPCSSKTLEERRFAESALVH